MPQVPDMVVGISHCVQEPGMLCRLAATPHQESRQGSEQTGGPYLSQGNRCSNSFWDRPAFAGQRCRSPRSIVSCHRQEPHQRSQASGEVLDAGGRRGLVDRAGRARSPTEYEARSQAPWCTLGRIEGCDQPLLQAHRQYGSGPSSSGPSMDARTPTHSNC